MTDKTLQIAFFDAQVNIVNIFALFHHMNVLNNPNERQRPYVCVATSSE